LIDYIADYDIGINKPDVPCDIHNSWTDILDSLASMANVPSALVMHLLPNKIEVASTSRIKPDNPYEVDASEHLGCGLYCETVIKEKSELYVKNSLIDEDWKDNPDIELGMISYYGLPLLWPDDKVFGTICILDKKDLHVSTQVKELIRLFKNSIENDLHILELAHLEKKLLQSEIHKQNMKLSNLNKNLEQRVKEEVEKNRKKDQQIIQQSRLVQMGEMISMIAHQWRQPLGAISSTLIDMKMKSELELFNLEEKQEVQKYESYINNSLNDIEGFVQNLTSTIDDFRYFYKQNKKAVTIKIEDVIEKSLNIINSSIVINCIDITKEYNYKGDIELYDSEMMQVILNILKNAQDNFQEKQTKNPYIRITTEDRRISICDNGGGIAEDIIDKIFDPYFSTKNEKNGTGLGLYMSKTIVEEHHNGKLNVENTDDGACFIIELGIVKSVKATV